MFRRIVFATAISCLMAFMAITSAGGQDDPGDYFKRLESISNTFERIQAAMEVAFDPSLYIGSIQNLNFEHKKFSEAYTNRKQRKYLSFALESSIVGTYLDLVNRVKANSDKISQDVVNRVIDTNQRKITLLQKAIELERDKGPKTAWVNIIRTSIDLGDYTEALEYAKLAGETYGMEREFLELKNEIDKVLEQFKEDKARAERLMTQKKYRDALVILKKLNTTKPDDTEVSKMYETTASYVKKMDQLFADAREYEKDGKLKEAYRTWENLLEFDPENKEAQKKIEKYRKQLKLGTTEIVTTCLNCSGQGYCSICKGSGLCRICNGYRKCIRCRGAGYFARRCPYCVCKDCRGNGLCTTCSGRGTVTCPSCGGSGFSRTTKTLSCSVCGGAGKSRFRDAPCPACGGSGKVVMNVNNICTACKGAKVIPCPTCAGNEKCKSCGGRGHMLSCSQCGGRGVLTADCNYCNRTGRCPECGGTGVCRYCNGSGKCPDCDGRGIIIKKIDEEKYLSEKNHFISVVTNPSGASVYLDGELRGKSPLEIENVRTGDHIVRLTKPGYDDFHYKTVFTENYTARFDIKLINRKSAIYRLLNIYKTKHLLLFRHYQEQENDSFMISLYVDGTNEWREFGDSVLGYEISELKREFKSQYNPRLKEKQVIDVSYLVLKKPDGTETNLLKNNLMQFNVYKAKIFDSSGKRFLYLVEGTRLGEFTVYNITDNEVILKDKSGGTFTLSKH